MELLFISLGGAILGLLARYCLPHRDRHGSALVPAIGVAFAAALWVVLTWLGWAWDGGWIWTVTLLATGVIVIVADLALSRTRRRADERLLADLSGGRAIPD